MTAGIDDLDSDFDLDDGIDLEGYEAKEGFRQVPAGIYEVEVKDLKPGKSKKDVPQVIFTYEVTSEGEYKGQTFQEYFQFTEQAKPYLKGRFVSLGCDASQDKFTKDDVIGVAAVAVLVERSYQQNGETKKAVNVGTVKMKGSPGGSTKKSSTVKKSGGNLI